MALAQFKGLGIHSHKFIDHRSKINILSIQEKEFRRTQSNQEVLSCNPENSLPAKLNLWKRNKGTQLDENCDLCVDLL